MKKQIVESCEMCSRETRSPTTIKVEGALLNVCGNCVSFGNVIEDKKPQLNYVKSQKTQNKNVGKGVSRTGGFKRKMSIKSDEKDKEYLIENYGRVINQARMKKGMTQEQLSSKTGVSQAYIKSIESQNMKPTDAVARKIEFELGIKLFESISTELQYNTSQGKGNLTVGDIVNITRYEYDK